MSFNIADERDAVMEADLLVAEVWQEVEREWNEPDDKLRLAMAVMSMPEDAWALVDDDTKNGIEEVLSG